MKMTKLFYSMITVGVLSAAPTIIDAVAGSQFASATAAEQNTDQAQERKSKRVPAMRERVYSQLARAQKVGEEEGTQAGLEVLNAVKERVSQLNSYERAMLWNFYGFMYYGADDIASATENFEKVVAEETIPETLYLSTLFSLAQLKTQLQEFDQALEYLSKWQAANNKPLKAHEHILFAQIYYQNKQFNETLEQVTTAIELTEKEGYTPKENWLILQRASYYELKQPENVTKVIEKLVKLYEKPKYWIQLAGMYGEIGQEKKQIGAMEAAWQAGYITKKNDIITLAQLYLFHGAPYKAAKLLDESIEAGKIAADERHLELLAQSYIGAKEDDKAVPVLVKASEIADTGKFDAQLAQTYLNTEKWQLAIDSAEKALERGGVDNLGNMHLVVGMASFNLKAFEKSLLAFNNAIEIKSSAKLAKQWIKYVKKEQSYHQQIAMVNTDTQVNE